MTRTMTRWLAGALSIASCCTLLVCCTPALPGPQPEHYFVVADAVVRSGQPVTAQQWAFLWQQLDQLAPGGRHVVVKLNFPDEGSDDLALAAGFTVVTISIQPDGDKDIVDDVLDTFVRPSDADLTSIENAISAYRHVGLVVHCTHGQDRTGLAIARDRVLYYHWSKAQARAEWQRIVGFPPHPLHGLDDTWEDWHP